MYVNYIKAYDKYEGHFLKGLTLSYSNVKLELGGRGWLSVLGELDCSSSCAYQWSS